VKESSEMRYIKRAETETFSGVKVRRQCPFFLLVNVERRS
jgi:hypothetical protein